MEDEGLALWRADRSSSSTVRNVELRLRLVTSTRLDLVMGCITVSECQRNFAFAANSSASLFDNSPVTHCVKCRVYSVSSCHFSNMHIIVYLIKDLSTGYLQARREELE